MNWKIASILIVSDTIMIANYKIGLFFLQKLQCIRVETTILYIYTSVKAESN